MRFFMLANEKLSYYNYGLFIFLVFHVIVIYSMTLRFHLDYLHGTFSGSLSHLFMRLFR